MLLNYFERVEEDYDSLMTNPLNKEKYPVFVDPTKDEIKELSKDTNNVRFISHNGKMFLFHDGILHAHAIKHLGLPISNAPPIHQAFLGIAKPNADGTLSYSGTNQVITRPNALNQYHRHILKYFK